ncbi:short-chain dehydrogenase [Paractinoplanes abujensis]|uniref:NAD(P)-dependent dehydrogenase (Short-subunit alcohol dehydrogenase family) n=1 Tax=Paractinoplanes abujensis TaxID=882441 RepID=A0A7W7G245_9ACTN|nr:SDR family NAD(P)-dependent oxidoreductase [Actinoplanes abujensis]MBB4693324.1 NAD(P)-dependent dehydrogenase (short-subunit alcohol dehydrogenase family) [Actinoplanes abujensis]GID24527.1 short-chain dehydrogenase [Actinoplanes abujensis]
MTITFITGANKGLGYETARRLVEAGHTVLLGCRDAARGAAAAQTLGARFVQIDVTDEVSVAAAAADVERHEGHIDVLINNAGVPGTFGSTDVADIREVLEVNVVGVVRTTSAFLPLLQRSDDPVIVNVSSEMGSLAATHDPARAESKVIFPAYTASKAALTMLTTQYAKWMPQIRINAADPGYTATDFNHHSGPQTVTEGTDAVVALATEGPGSGTGRFVNREGDIAFQAGPVRALGRRGISR